MGEMITNHFFSKSTLQCRDFGILIVQIGPETKKLWYFENDENSDDVIYILYNLGTLSVCVSVSSNLSHLKTTSLRAYLKRLVVLYAKQSK